jgi:hypothetical protein
MNINQNIAECIKSTGNIGSTLYTNICNGQQNTVSWGSAEWIAAILVVVLVLVFATVIFKLLFER